MPKGENLSGSARLRNNANSDTGDHDDLNPFQQSDDIFSVPEEPVTEDVVEAYHDDVDSEEGADEGGNIGKTQAWRPWYRRPSAWWMLVLMPLSAMTLAGVQPSAVQIYTDLVCRELRPDLSPLYAPDRQQECASDPKVQALASKLMTSIMTSLGILTCITAASWASLSDRIGRKTVLAIASVGVLCSYTVLIFVYAYSERLPGGFWFCIVGSSIYGLLGGTATATATTTAYITDCTPSFSRARMLSLTLGLRFTGMAIGPTLSSFLVHTFGSPVAAVFLVLFVHAFYFVTVLFVLPESLSREKREENRARWSATRAVARTEERESGSELSVLVKIVASLFAFLRPLEVVKPIEVYSTSPESRVHKDWSLTFIAISSAAASLILASYQSQFQYGAATFGWSAVELGYWFSGVVAARALTLTVFLPIIIKLYHHFTSPKAVNHADPTDSASTPLLTDVGSSPVSDARPPKHTSTHQHPHHTPAFDLIIAQLSLLLEVVCYGLLPFFASASIGLYKPIYIVLSILSACGAGYGPAFQSLAVELYTRRGGTESGKLFGTISVIQATSSQIIGPTLYGLTYSAIVESYPQGIFFVSFGAVSVAVAALFFVELPKAPDREIGSAHMA